MAKVTVNGQTYEVDENAPESLMEQLRAQGVEIVAACNGAGICQTCAITVHSGELTEKTETEEMFALPDGQRMSCQCKPLSNSSDLDIELVY